MHAEQPKFLQVQMKLINGEKMHKNEELVRTFVLAAFEKKQLAEQIDTLYESVDSLGATLDINSRQRLFENTSEQMKKIGSRLAEIEQQLNEMLPDVLAASESFDYTTPLSPDADSTFSFAAPDSTLSQTKTLAPELPRPLSLPQIRPNKPTLIAEEPAPLPDDDDDNYEFEDDEDYDLGDDGVFDRPLSSLPSTSPAMVSSSELPSSPSDTHDDIVFDDAPMSNTEQTDESWHKVSAKAVFAPKATMQYGADAVTRGSDDSGNSGNSEITKVAQISLIRNAVHAENNDVSADSDDETSDNTFIDDDSETLTYSVQPVNPELNTEQPADLASMLEPEDDESAAELDMMPQTHKPDAATDASSDNSAETQEGAGDDGILFWKERPSSTDHDNGSEDAHDFRQSSPGAAAIKEKQLILSRIPSLFPRDAMSSTANFDDADNTLDHIQNYEDVEDDRDVMADENGVLTNDDTSATGDETEEEYTDDVTDDIDDATDNVEVATDDDAASVEADNPFERELYEMLDMHSDASASVAAKSPNPKQTLSGLGPEPSDSAPNATYQTQTDKDSQ